MSGQALYEQSHGFNTHWDKLDLKAQRRWNDWAARTSQSTYEQLMPETYTNEFQALINIGYRLGSNIVMILDADNLGSDWGGPSLGSQPGLMIPVKLDAAFHQYQHPETDNEAFSVTLGFDQLYRCRIPWQAIAQVIFRPPDEPEPQRVA